MARLRHLSNPIGVPEGIGPTLRPNHFILEGSWAQFQRSGPSEGPSGDELGQHLGPIILYWKAQSWAQFQRSGPSEGPSGDELGQHLDPTTLYWKAQSCAQFQRSGPSESPCGDELG